MQLKGQKRLATGWELHHITMSQNLSFMVSKTLIISSAKEKETFIALIPCTNRKQQIGQEICVNMENK